MAAAAAEVGSAPTAAKVPTATATAAVPTAAATAPTRTVGFSEADSEGCHRGHGQYLEGAAYKSRFSHLDRHGGSLRLRH
jgi:hypothetical protein